jgi:tripartite-type tricarboxylate transporter receptor subunit TctC
MNFPRRKLLRLAASAAALPALSRVAWTQEWPARPARIIVGFAAGGAFDLVARLIGHWLSERLGEQFIVENRPGGSGNIAAEAVARAAPDGYAFLLGGSTNTVNTSLYDNLQFDFMRDLAPIAALAREPNIVVVNPSVPVMTIPEFIAYGKANPGKLNMASAGNGSPAHVAGELFQMMAGINMIHVPYRGGPPALTDLLGGQVQVMFVATSASIAYIRAGRLRPLAVTTASGSDLLPDLPTVASFLPGFDVSLWTGLFAPRAIPAAIVDKLNQEINAGLADPQVRARLAAMGSQPMAGSPADLGKLVADETEKWRKVVKFAGIKPG